MKRHVLPLKRGRGEATEAIDFAATYQELLPVLLRYAMRLVDRDGAEDVVQDAMLKYLAQRGEREWELTESDLRMRLLVMVRDEGLDSRRRLRIESKVLQLLSGPTAAMRRWTSVRRPFEDAELLRRIEEVLKRLPPHVREPWFLSREVGLSIDEVSKVLRLHPTSCRSAIAKANAELRKGLVAKEITPRTLRGRDAE